LTVSNVTFQAGSSLVSTVTPTGAGRLAVVGTTTINAGTEADIHVLPGFYPLQSRYTLLTSGGGAVVGQFQAIDTENPFLVAQLIYNAIGPGSVELALSIQSISNVIKGGNAGAIAKCLTTQNMAQDPALEQLISGLIFLPIEEVRDVLDEMQPSQLRALTVAEQENALFAMQLLNLRMGQWSRSTCEKAISQEHRGNFWISLAGNWTDQRDAEHNVGYRAPAAGLAVGFDGRFRDNVFFGCMLEYGHAALTWRGGQGTANIDRVSVGPYAGWMGKAFVNAAVLGSFASFHAARGIPFFDLTANSSHTGGSVLAHLDGGFLLHPASKVTLSPFAAFDLIFGWEGSFGEGGARALDFSIGSSSSSLLRSEAGLKVTNCAMRSHGKWVHELKASWVQESRFHGREMHAKFRQFPCEFTVKGLYPSRSFVDLAMGLSFIFHRDVFAASLKYEGQFGEGASVQSGMAELVMRF